MMMVAENHEQGPPQALEEMLSIPFDLDVAWG